MAMKTFFLRIIPVIIIIIACAASFWLGRFTASNRNGEEVNSIPVFNVDALPKGFKRFPDTLLAKPWLRDAYVFNFRDFLMIVPRDPKVKALEIFYDLDSKKKMISIGHDGIGVNLDLPKLDDFGVNDTDGDGIFEEFYYRYIDKKGNVIGSVEDRDRDGQPEIRTVWNPNSEKPMKAYVWVKNQWHLLEKRGDARGVTIGGIWTKVKRVNHRYTLVK